MSKQRFVDLLTKLREWSAVYGNEELNRHLNELDAGVSAMDAPLSDDSGGGN